MKAHIPLILIALLATGAIAGAVPPEVLTVAVYDFTDSAGDGRGCGGKVTTLVTAGLTLETNIVMLGRGQLSKALTEQAFGISGLVSSEAAAKIGQLTGAKVLVAGQVIKTEDSRLVIVATIVGTETGRLFTARVEGGPEELMNLTADLSRKIAQTIGAQVANLLASTGESRAERVDRIVKDIRGTKRPVVSIAIYLDSDKAHRSATAEGELGALLLRAGFTLVDVNSERKPDVEITGIESISPGPRRGGLYTFQAVLDLKAQERQTGAIIALDHQEGSATDMARGGANRAAQANAVDELAVRVLPLLAQ